ncbi:MAG: TrmH family RNA methyltransferase [bacterium]|nr:TrmH family RNA methyltransferase [bacterium]
MLKLNAKELRERKPTEKEMKSIKRLPLYLVLDNVLDTYNIGGLFRLADAVAAEKVILCGGSETPPSSRIHKAAVGTEEWVAWEYYPSAREAILNLKAQSASNISKISNLSVIAVEQSSRSTPYTTYDIPNTSKAVALVVGHETDGVSKDVLDLADSVLEIPMFGVNKSLNVIVSAAIATYKIVEKLNSAE